MFIIQVADFGRSRDLADENYYVSQGQDKIPVKWTAPEAIHYKKYSTASDVWAYGCLLYEIWSVGYKPFEGVANVKVSPTDHDTNGRVNNQSRKKGSGIACKTQTVCYDYRSTVKDMIM